MSMESTSLFQEMRKSSRSSDPPTWMQSFVNFSDSEYSDVTDDRVSSNSSEGM